MLRTLISTILIFCHCAFIFSVDYDVIVLGTSPICLLEALYQHHTGKRVLIVDGADSYGGAWKSISVCGVPYVELGCHLIGSNQLVSDFLQDYVGCKTVSMNEPKQTYAEHKGANGFYLSGGSKELIDNLIQLIESTNIVVFLNKQIESVTLDDEENRIIAHTNDEQYTAFKMIVTPYSHLRINNHPTISLNEQSHTKTKHYHLYALINDPTPARFTYRSGLGNGSTRIMNLTNFISLDKLGYQLIVFQVQNTQSFLNAETYLTALKKQDLLDPSAYILQTDTFIYEQSRLNQALIKQDPNKQSFFEMLYTHKILDMTRYIPKWKEALPIYDLTPST